jgi:hypothetical protein
VFDSTPVCSRSQLHSRLGSSYGLACSRYYDPRRYRNSYAIDVLPIASRYLISFLYRTHSVAALLRHAHSLSRSHSGVYYSTSLTAPLTGSLKCHRSSTRAAYYSMTFRQPSCATHSLLSHMASWSSGPSELVPNLRYSGQMISDGLWNSKEYSSQ